MNQDIMLRVKEFNNSKILKFFFEELKYLIDELRLKNNSENLALTVRNDDRKRFSVNINNRLVFGITYQNKSFWICYMVYENDLSKIKNYNSLGNPEVFAKMKNEEQAVLIWIKYEDVLSQIDILKELWINCCKEFLPKYVKSNLRVYHLPELFEMATNNAVLQKYLNNIPDNNIHTQEFFNEEDFENLKKYAGDKKSDSKEHEIIYNKLRKTYEKIAYWAKSLVEKDFTHVNGYVDVLRKPTNQANVFESYQWAKIYPSNNSSKELAFTININNDNGFTIKIDTVGLKESDERRKEYLKFRGNYNSSEIVYNIPKESILNKDWDYLINISSEYIHSLISIYYELEELLGLSKPAINNNFSTVVKQKTMSLNTILYGPPGTGKTYNTVNKALELIGENIEGKARQEIKELFNTKVKEGQIVFTTFHQSMSYEDFIEGIKPLKPLSDDKFVKYDIQPGIFYNICEIAKSNFQNSRAENKGKLNFDDAFEKFKEDWEKNPEMKFPLKTEGYDFTIIGFTNTSIQFRKASGSTSHTLSIGTLKELYYGKEFDFKQGVGIYYPAVLKKVQSYKSEKSAEVVLKNYVLVIDEINRGNVSQIFGELITLIEEDKRLGKEEALEVILPYSKDKFGVPPNLYILGTMNTADRSVEALDTALRRRFEFECIEPKPKLINSFYLLQRLWGKHWNIEPEEKYREWKKAEDNFIKLTGMEKKENEYSSLDLEYDYDELDTFLSANPEEIFKDIVTFNNGVSLDLLLEAINKRLEILLTKDHLIGHAWLMNVFNLDDLQTAFNNKILPLLQEYFYNDYAKIGLVLGDRFVQQTKAGKSLFAKFKDENELSVEYEDRLTYTLKNCSDLTIDDFKSIYQ